MLSWLNHAHRSEAANATPPHKNDLALCDWNSLNVVAVDRSQAARASSPRKAICVLRLDVLNLVAVAGRVASVSGSRCKLRHEHAVDWMREGQRCNGKGRAEVEAVTRLFAVGEADYAFALTRPGCGRPKHRIVARPMASVTLARRSAMS